MTQSQDVRRLRDGSIDYDFYRARATTLRAQMIRETLLPKRTPKAALFAAVAALVVTIGTVVPTRWI
jgi:hypothetical protein